MVLRLRSGIHGKLLNSWLTGGSEILKAELWLASVPSACHGGYGLALVGFSTDYGGSFSYLASDFLDHGASCQPLQRIWGHLHAVLDHVDAVDGADGRQGTDQLPVSQVACKYSEGEETVD